MDDAMAEFALALYPCHWRRGSDRSQEPGGRRWRHQVTETIDSKTALVVGAGAIGGAVGRLLTKWAHAVDAVASVSCSSNPEVRPFGTIHAFAELPAVVGAYDYVISPSP